MNDWVKSSLQNILVFILVQIVIFILTLGIPNSGGEFFGGLDFFLKAEIVGTIAYAGFVLFMFTKKKFTLKSSALTNSVHIVISTIPVYLTLVWLSLILHGNKRIMIISIVLLILVASITVVWKNERKKSKERNYSRKGVE